MMTTFVQLAVDQARECMTVQLATSAKELAVIQNNTGTATMINWPFPSYPPTPWTQKQIKEYAQQQRAQLPEAPL